MQQTATNVMDNMEAMGFMSRIICPAVGVVQARWLQHPRALYWRGYSTRGVA